MVPRVLIIAGSDSGGGAGIQADIKTVTMMGGHAMTAITAITAQNTLGVTGVMPVPTEMVLAQIDAVVSDIGVDVVKIGMIGSAEVAASVADRLADLGVPVVFDPVMVASSGAELADEQTIAAFQRMLQVATLVTPNMPELAVLSGRSVEDEAGMLLAARSLAAEHQIAVLAKGGHLNGDEVVDLLVEPGGSVTRWSDAKIDTRHTHGTGCTLASGIACGVAGGKSLGAAVDAARIFVRSALLAAPGFGGGHGPMGHWAGATGAMNMNQVTLSAADYAASIAFYGKLGLRQIVDSPANGYARFECPGGATLSIHAGEGAGTGGALVYLESGELDAWDERLVGHGITIDQMPRDESWVWCEARVREPAGNRL